MFSHAIRAAHVCGDTLGRGSLVRTHRAGAGAASSAGFVPLGRILYAFFSPLCHQLGARSFHLFGWPLAVCGSALPFTSDFFSHNRVPFARNLLRGARPGGCSSSLRSRRCSRCHSRGDRVHESTNAVRAVTGAWFGVLLPSSSSRAPSKESACCSPNPIHVRSNQRKDSSMLTNRETYACSLWRRDHGSDLRHTVSEPCQLLLLRGDHAGGFMAVFFYKKDLTESSPPLTNGDGLGLGALAGVVGAVVTMILTALFHSCSACDGGDAKAAGHGTRESDPT